VITRSIGRGLVDTVEWTDVDYWACVARFREQAGTTLVGSASVVAATGSMSAGRRTAFPSSYPPTHLPYPPPPPFPPPHPPPS